MRDPAAALREFESVGVRAFFIDDRRTNERRGTYWRKIVCIRIAACADKNFHQILTNATNCANLIAFEATRSALREFAFDSPI
jgi:hypothetical protein